MTSPPLSRQMPDGSRRYVNPRSGEIVPSVTTCLDILAKPALIPWAAKMAATYASDNWEVLGDLEPVERIRDIKDAHQRISDAAANKGDIVHEVVDSWMSGRPYPDYPKTIASYIDQFISFLTEFRPIFLANEATVWNREYSYAGTCDFIAEIDGATVLGDVKSGKRVYPEVSLQLAALAGCEFIIDQDGNESPLPEIGKLMALHIRPRSWHLYEVTARVAAFQAFKAARALWEWREEISHESLKLVSP